MALLTDRNTEKDLSERLSEFVQFGMVLNYMLDIGTIELNDLERIFFDSDREKAILIYSRLLKEIKPDYLTESYSLYSKKYPNDEGLDSSEYSRYVNKCCVGEMINKISEKDKLDKTYINTYDYLLKCDSQREVCIRK